MTEMASKGVKANIITYNTIFNECVKRKEFGVVSEVLKLMEMEEVEYNAATYSVLIEYFGNIGKHDEVEKLFDEMRERRVDVHLYTWMIHWHCGRGSIKKAISLFDELSEKGLVPNAHVYGALINGLCKTGQMEAAQLLLNDIKGMMDDALRLVAAMEKKGFEPDVFTYNIMASEMINFTTLIDIHCKEGNIVEAKKLFQQMLTRGKSPNIVTYNALIDGHSKKGELKDTYKLRDEMEAKGITPHVYTYASLVHGPGSKRSNLYGNNFGVERSDEALRLYNEMISLGHVPDQRVYSSIVYRNNEL
ncbi:hypothetical protein GQ457_12G010460 [Hibiscus cannabinus]